LPVVINGRETSSLSLKEGHGLKVRVFEHRVLRRIFRMKNFEVIGDWIKLHNEKVHNLCPSLDIIRMIKSRE
jgi:hypothetical protein